MWNNGGFLSAGGEGGEEEERMKKRKRWKKGERWRKKEREVEKREEESVSNGHQCDISDSEHLPISIQVIPIDHTSTLPSY